jgi:CRISPR/Cas system CSM-associated protein Csm2 small subunit
MMDSSHYFQIGAAIAERNRKRDEQREQMGELSARNKAMRTVLPYLAQQAGISAEMLDPFLDGSPDESPRAEAAKFDTLLKSIVQAGGLRQQQQQIDAADLARETAIAERDHTRDERREQMGEISARSKAMRTVLPYLAQQAGISAEMLAPFLEGSPDESPRAESAKFDTLLKSIVQAGSLRQQQQQIDAADLANRQSGAGADAHEDFNRNLQAMLRYDSYGAGAPLRPEIAAEAARLAGGTAGRMARLGARITPEMLAGFEKGDAEKAAMSRVGTAFTAPDGSQYLWQNRGQVVPLSVPLSRKGVGGGMTSTVGKLIDDYKRAKEAGDEESAAILLQAAQNAAKEKPNLLAEYLKASGGAPEEKGAREEEKKKGSGGRMFAGKHLAGRTVRGTDGKLYRVDAEGYASPVASSE